MSTIQVSLDTNANPPVTCNPQTTSVNQGNQTINWTQAQNQSFTFTSLTFANNPSCFGTPVVTNSGITVTDDNTSSGDYPYTIVVTSGGYEYSTVKSGPSAGGSDPTIKNK